MLSLDSSNGGPQAAFFFSRASALLRGESDGPADFARSSWAVCGHGSSSGACGLSGLAALAPAQLICWRYIALR
jgi:hypothetical protein